MSDFRWLIEAPGQMYLTVQRLSQSDNFIWTADHDKALAFRSEDQATAVMMAVREMALQLGKTVSYPLFGFEAPLGNAKAVEHAWASGRPDTGGPGAVARTDQAWVTTPKPIKAWVTK